MTEADLKKLFGDLPEDQLQYLWWVVRSELIENARPWTTYEIQQVREVLLEIDEDLGNNLIMFNDPNLGWIATFPEAATHGLRLADETLVDFADASPIRLNRDDVLSIVGLEEPDYHVQCEEAGDWAYREAVNEGLDPIEDEDVIQDRVTRAVWGCEAELATQWWNALTGALEDIFNEAELEMTEREEPYVRDGVTVVDERGRPVMLTYWELDTKIRGPSWLQVAFEASEYSGDVVDQLPRDWLAEHLGAAFALGEARADYTFDVKFRRRLR